MSDSAHILEFWYKNHRDDEERRQVLPMGLRFGTSEYYPEPQWLLQAYCFDRREVREFAMLRIEGIT